MPFIVALALAVAQVAGAPPPTAPAPTGVEAENEPRLRTADQLVRDHQPQQALDVLAVVLAAYDADHVGEKRRLYCMMSMQEGVVYAGLAIRDKNDAVMIAPGYCVALYLKGFALVDLGRTAEAKATYQRLLALAPMHAQYLTEFGQLARLDKDWPRMLSLCKEAQGDAAFGDPATTATQEGAALRCQGYALIEQKKWSDAEKRYRAALKIDPGDTKAQGELRYIAEHRQG